MSSVEQQIVYYLYESYIESSKFDLDILDKYTEKIDVRELVKDSSSSNFQETKKVLDNWRKEIEYRDILHENELKKCKTLADKIRYAYSCGCTLAEDVCDFLEYHNCSIVYSTVATVLSKDKSKNALEQIDPSLYSDVHSENLSRLTTPEEKVRYAIEQGYSKPRIINAFFKANGENLAKSYFEKISKYIAVIGEPIDEKLIDQKHVDNLKNLNSVEEKITYAYDEGYRTFPLVYKFLKANVQNISISIKKIQKELTNICASSRSFNSELTEQIHIDNLKNCVSNFKKVEYALHQGHHKSADVFAFLKANESTLKTSQIYDSIWRVKGGKNLSQLESSLQKQEHIDELSKCGGDFDKKMQYAWEHGYMTLDEMYAFLKANKQYFLRSTVKQYVKNMQGKHEKSDGNDNDNLTPVDLPSSAFPAHFEVKKEMSDCLSNEFSTAFESENFDHLNSLAITEMSLPRSVKRENNSSPSTESSSKIEQGTSLKKQRRI